jgi:hypothetical protein
MVSASPVVAAEPGRCDWGPACCGAGCSEPNNQDDTLAPASAGQKKSNTHRNAAEARSGRRGDRSCTGGMG